MNIQFIGINHIQICVPKEKERQARKFYIDLLGLKEIEKPAFLKKNGGFWLKIAGIELHIGVEDQIHPSKRHPAFEVLHLQKIKEEMLERGIRIKEDTSLPNFHRFSFFDPFGNRIELLERISGL